MNTYYDISSIIETGANSAVISLDKVTVDGFSNCGAIIRNFRIEGEPPNYSNIEETYADAQESVDDYYFVNSYEQSQFQAYTVLIRRSLLNYYQRLNFLPFQPIKAF